MEESGEGDFTNLEKKIYIQSKRAFSKMMKHHEKEKRHKAAESSLAGLAGLLAELHSARDNGHLTTDEFTAAKQKLIHVLTEEEQPALPQFNATPSHSYAEDHRSELEVLRVNLPRALSQSGGYTEGYARKLTYILLNDVKISTIDEIQRFIRGQLQLPAKCLDDSDRRSVIRLLKRSPEFLPFNLENTIHVIDEGESAPNNIPCDVKGLKTLLFPAYVWVKFKGMKSMSEKQQTIDMTFTLIVYLNFGELGSEDNRENLSSFLNRLHFTVNEKPYRLHDEFTKAEWSEHEKGQGQWLYKVTKRMDIEKLSFVNVNAGRSKQEGVEGHTDHRSMYRMWENFPFDRPNLCFRIELKSDTLKEGDFQDYTIRWNIHEFKPKEGGSPVSNRDQPERKASVFSPAAVQPPVNPQVVMVSFKACADSLPNFDLMEKWRVSFPPERKRQLSYHPLMQIQIHLYRHPGYALRTMFFPLMVTNLCTITTLFFRVTDYHDRITTQVTELLAIFAFLNYSASQLPDVPVTTLMDWMIFSSIFMTFLATMDSLLLWMAEPSAPFRIEAPGYAESIRSIDVVVRIAMVCVSAYWFIFFGLNWLSYRKMRSSNSVEDMDPPNFSMMDYVIPQTINLPDYYLSKRSVMPANSPPRTPEMQGRPLLISDPSYP